MSEFQRGRVTKVTFEIEYPDGSTATSEVSDAQDLKGIALSGDSVDGEVIGQFNVSADDWTRNPTMLLEYSEPRESGERFRTFCSKDSHCVQ